ncbi:MAG: MBL fold metallo-hydrolase [Paraprevotella sp.]|nr:MBL fold metallo-hydrolase [Paraprevotella sp.]
MLAVYIIIGVMVFTGIAVAVFLHTPAFGRLPRGERQRRIERSPHFRDGQFRNLEPTEFITSKRGRWGVMGKFLFGKHPGNLRPAEPMEVVKTDLRALSRDSDLWVWFGHSSYLFQAGGKRILVDPVSCFAAPVSFVNKAFSGTDIYQPEDFPDIDLLIITHDHWDHLDMQTVKALRTRIGRVICPLGVGEHFERWGFKPEQLIELDWYEQARLDDGFMVHALTARQFTGRGLRSNRTFLASFLFESPLRKVFIGGDGGYGNHFVDIGRRFPDIDVAVMENGQYSTDWRYIHTLPEFQGAEADALGAKHVLTVHHSKYALARHPWNEPLENARCLSEKYGVDVWRPRIGEVIEWDV